MQGTTANWRVRCLCKAFLTRNLKDLMDEGHDYDPDYEGLEISANVETSLTKDGELPVEIEAGPLNPPPKTKEIPISSQEETSRRSAHD